MKYWTKCGIKFDKTSNAATTGYKIDPADEKCSNCPFQVEVTKGYPAVHDRWECRAGSNEPNNTTDWTGKTYRIAEIYVTHTLVEMSTAFEFELENEFGSSLGKYGQNSIRIPV